MTSPHQCVHPIMLRGLSVLCVTRHRNLLASCPSALSAEPSGHLSPFLRFLPFIPAPSREFSYGTMYLLVWWKKKIFWLVKMIRQTLFRDVCNCCRISCIRSKRKWRFISQRTCLSGWREPRMDSCLGKASKVRARGPCWTDTILAKDGMHSCALKNLISDRGEVLFLNWLSQAFVEAGFFKPTKLEGECRPKSRSH